MVVEQGTIRMDCSTATTLPLIKRSHMGTARAHRSEKVVMESPTAVMCKKKTCQEAEANIHGLDLDPSTVSHARLGCYERWMNIDKRTVQAFHDGSFCDGALF